MLAFLGKGQFELKLSFVLILLILGISLVYPLYSVLNQSFFNDSGFTFDNYLTFLSKDSFWQSLFNSFKVSGAVALFATTIAFISAYGLNFCAYSQRLKSAIEIIILLPLFLPSITYGFAVIYSFGRQGLITRLIGQLPFSIYGFYGLLIAGVIYTLPPAFMILNNAFKYVDKNFITVSKVMGDSKARTFYITGIRPVVGSMVAAFILSFFLNFTDFGIPTSIAGKYDVIATTLYATMMGAVPDFANGSVVAMAMLVPSIIAIVLLRYCDKLNFRYNKISLAHPVPDKLRDGGFLVFYLALTLMLLSVFAIMFIVPFVKSWPYQPWFTLETVKRIFAESAIFGVYINSLYVALLTAVCGTILCYLAGMINARSHLNGWCKSLMDVFAMVTNTVPGMVLGVGFLFAFTGTSLTNTFLILIIANVVHFFTTPYLMAKQAFSKMNASWETTGALMGDTWFKTVRRVVIPNTKSTIIEMFSYFFVNAMVTISAIVFLAGARTMVTTVKIKELQYFEKFDAIFVLSLLIFFTNVAAKLILDRLAVRKSVKSAKTTKTETKTPLEALS
ncbi:ABC transporter permease subunit [uncultured Succinatimonas sp.]|uniref:ABC transporter permease subunit n=1 Tax=uncultured Succinatimonas sp. TaxID=1262973 RepID=UPI0025EC5C34|nr:ABC transporter permease subunit [uncultured Succinatimonas sp.]